MFCGIKTPGDTLASESVTLDSTSAPETGLRGVNSILLPPEGCSKVEQTRGLKPKKSLKSRHMLLAKQRAVTWSLEEPNMDRGPATRVALARIKSNRARKLILRRCFRRRSPPAVIHSLRSEAGELM